MHKVLFVVGVTLACLFTQIIFAKVIGAWCVPNFVLIAVVFFNLYRGLRHGLGAAFWGGFLLDSFSGNIAGLNVFSFVMCAFLTVWIKRYMYQPGVAASRILVVFIIVTANTLIQFLLIATQVDVGLREAFISSMMPEIILTTFVAGYTFERLKWCASQLFA